VSATAVDVALLAFGGPESVDVIPDFLARMTGRPPTDAVVSAVATRYIAIGGGSPLPDVTRRQAAALQTELAKRLTFPIRVRAGFLYADPSVADCLRELDAAEVIALPLSPYSSRLTSAAYRKALDAAGGERVPTLEGWFADRGFVHAISARIAEALDGADAAEYAVLFTAHSVPTETIEAGDPYVDQIQQTIAQLVPVVMPGDWRLGFQSKGRGGGDWIGPDVDDVVRELAAAGWPKLLVVPVGFVSDHVETLFDLDVTLRAVVEENGMTYRRSDTPNDSPQFIAALADIVVEHLSLRPGARPPARPVDGADPRVAG
jgi:ferrochelatase